MMNAFEISLTYSVLASQLCRVGVQMAFILVGDG
jgi:hypothetical protein